MVGTLFITGTDTNVGKTAVTALLAAHLSSKRSSFRAVKPFCSGERTDAVLLSELQQGRLSLAEVNPYYFSEPLAPWSAARKEGREISFKKVLSWLEEQAALSETLLVEGAGGLLAPLGPGFSAAELIVELHATVILVAANRLGVLNHTLLTLEALQSRGVSRIKVALVEVNAKEAACETNESDLRLLCSATELHRIPYLSGYAAEAQFIRRVALKLDGILARLLK